ncbi:sigma-70 family RNA polymerase sigma factor [Flavobacteriaceae bacterium TK19130]|nr:sigma-70 family RNA polymerase sigma factor [Thermobacterium salinum]
MCTETDQQLIKATLQGDTRAYGRLVEKYQYFVYTIIVRMLKVPEEAEEVAQDTFVKAYDALSTFRGDSKFSSWLYRIAYRKALDALRKQKRIPLSDVEVETISVADLDTALEQLQQKERTRIIKKAIATLLSEEAALMTFYYYEDLSVREIAKIMELTEDNVKVKLFRSRKKLKGILKEYILPEKTKHNGKAI